MKTYSDAEINWFRHYSRETWEEHFRNTRGDVPSPDCVDWDMVENIALKQNKEGRIPCKGSFSPQETFLVPPDMMKIAASLYAGDEFVQECLPDIPVLRKCAELILFRSKYRYCFGCQEFYSVLPGHSDFHSIVKADGNTISLCADCARDFETYIHSTSQWYRDDVLKVISIEEWRRIKNEWGRVPEHHIAPEWRIHGNFIFDILYQHAKCINMHNGKNKK